ncbi:MAG TPA: hypothetical protein VGJ21_25775 [Terracidiphilus sp.]|jgi:hypothetical protein
MNLNAVKIWEIAGASLLIAGAATVVAWQIFFRKRPTAAEIELARRQFLTQNGRIVDGTLLDVTELPGEEGEPLTMLIYEYRIGGVDYECSQDITLMGDVVTVAHVRSGFPCSVRYQPGHPQNSIVVAEQWSGLRNTIPFFPAWDEFPPPHRPPPHAGD